MLNTLLVSGDNMIRSHFFKRGSAPAKGADRLAYIVWFELVVLVGEPKQYDPEPVRMV